MAAVPGFRPLAGIMVLILNSLQSFVAQKEGFPSPCGDYGSYHAVSRRVQPKRIFVSVPLRGLWFLSVSMSMNKYRKCCSVSVPLRGLWFLSSNRRHHTYSMRDRFRPLAGIMVLIWNADVFILDMDTVFPSPCGDYGSYLHGVVSRSQRTYPFPSPCGDYGSYLYYAEYCRYGINVCFRPLAGIMVLIGTPRQRAG